MEVLGRRAEAQKRLPPGTGNFGDPVFKQGDHTAGSSQDDSAPPSHWPCLSLTAGPPAARHDCAPLAHWLAAQRRSPARNQRGSSPSPRKLQELVASPRSIDGRRSAPPALGVTHCPPKRRGLPRHHSREGAAVQKPSYSGNAVPLATRNLTLPVSR